MDYTTVSMLADVETKRKYRNQHPAAIVLTLLFALFSPLIAVAATPSGPRSLILLLGPAIAIVLIGAVFAYYVYCLDQSRNATVLLYRLDAQALDVWTQFISKFRAFAASSGRWEVEARGRVSDTKHNAGASFELNRSGVAASIEAPAYIRCNIDPPKLSLAGRNLFFFPDIVLLEAPGSIGAVSYDSLSFAPSPLRFIEDDFVPKDATVVGHTWKYVNKAGGPDKRFRDNPKIPIVSYDRLEVQGPGGTVALLICSQRGTLFELAAAMERMAWRSTTPK